MVRIPELDPVDFLVHRRFPDASKLRAEYPLHHRQDQNTRLADVNWKKRLEEIDAYEAELRAKPEGELNALFQREEAAHKRELEQKAIEEEQQRFFNQPSANADFEYWTKTAYWRLEEAVALILGKNPEVVSSGRLDDQVYYPPSPFVESYRRTRQLTIRAEHMKELSDPVKPKDFLKWAERIGLDVPAPLKEGVDVCTSTEPKVVSSEAQASPVEKSPYWLELKQKAEAAIAQFPEWSPSQRKVQKTANLKDWLCNNFKLTDREAQILIKVLSDIYKEIP